MGNGRRAFREALGLVMSPQPHPVVAVILWVLSALIGTVAVSEHGVIGVIGYFAPLILVMCALWRLPLRRFRVGWNHTDTTQTHFGFVLYPDRPGLHKYRHPEFRVKTPTQAGKWRQVRDPSWQDGVFRKTPPTIETFHTPWSFGDSDGKYRTLWRANTEHGPKTLIARRAFRKRGNALERRRLPWLRWKSANQDGR